MGGKRGVQFEAAILRDLVLDDRAAWSRKILTVLLPGVTISDIPQFLGPYGRTHYPVTLTPAGAAGVVRVLTGQPEFRPPPLGPVPVLAPAPAALPSLPVAGHVMESCVRVTQGRVSTTVAERFYRNYLTIAERLAGADPTNAEAHEDLEAIRARLEEPRCQATEQSP